MRIRELGDATTLVARDQNLAHEIARATTLSAAAVRRRLASLHGKTLVRTAFEKEWPNYLDEIALTLAVDALPSRSFISQVAKVVGLETAIVRGRLERAGAGESVRSVFSKEWFDPRMGSPSEIGDTAVVVARDLGFGPRIAEIKGASRRSVLRKLEAAHGRTLVRTLFEPWPDDVASPAPPQAARGPTPAPAAKARLEPGVIVAGRYELLERLGKGGFGEAWKARDNKAPGKPERVLKFATETEASLESLRTEMEKAFELTHPNICKLCDWQEDELRGTFLVYVYGGRSLAQLLESVGRIHPTVMRLITTGVARALDYAHERGVIHHDVSPGNILVDDQGNARITDFGVAKSSASHRTTGGSETVVGTSTSIAWNPAYVAPEIVTHGESRPASDQYSLARVVCSMLEGRELKGPSAPRRFEALNDQQNAALARALNLDPHDRFSSCTAFASALFS